MGRYWLRQKSNSGFSLPFRVNCRAGGEGCGLWLGQANGSRPANEFLVREKHRTEERQAG